MKITNERPTEGQFVAVWAHDGKMWSQTIRIICGREVVYNESYDDFDFEISPISDADLDVTYMVE